MKKSVLGLMLSRGVLVSLVGMAMSFCFAGCATDPASWKPLIIEKGIIQCDTVWEKEVIIKGDVEIDRGATLTIMPGTVVKFVKIEANGPDKLYAEDKVEHFPRAELIIRGKILAQGTREKMILFTSADESPRVADWGAINMLDTEDNVLEYCEICYGHTSVHGHGGQVTVANCYFHDNGVAIGHKTVKEYKTEGSMTILNNRITKNGGGVLCSTASRTTISHNEITYNKFFGIYGKKRSVANVTYNNITHNGKGIILWLTQGFSISENNIYDNEKHNISLMEGQKWDVDVGNNWWGTTDVQKIKDSMWDRDEDETLGEIDFSGFAASPIERAGASW